MDDKVSNPWGYVLRFRPELEKLVAPLLDDPDIDKATQRWYQALLSLQLSLCFRERWEGSERSSENVDVFDVALGEAVRLMMLAAEMGAATSLENVTIGRIGDERDAALSSLAQLRTWKRHGDNDVLDDLEAIAVRRARDLGASWRKIGEALRMSAQGIQQRAQDRGWVTVDEHKDVEE